jgi:uncharacterized protein YqeY
MSLRTRFTDEMKIAMKEKQTDRLSTIRMMIAKLKEIDIDARGSGKEQSDDATILAMLMKMIKQRQDSIKMYLDGGREELAEEFLPKQLSEDETYEAIKDAIAVLGAKDIKDMGKVIAHLKEHYAGQMDFAAVSQKVKGALA